EGNLTARCVPQIELSFDVVAPGGRIGILKIRHEDVGAGIEAVDDHLPVHGPGNFDPPVAEVVRYRSDGPLPFPDGGGFREETGAGGRPRSPAGAAAFARGVPSESPRTAGIGPPRS